MPLKFRALLLFLFKAKRHQNHWSKEKVTAGTYDVSGWFFWFRGKPYQIRFMEMKGYEKGTK